jgi:hypothetical protein
MSPLRPSFLRHVNANGIVDSVCRNCYVTVASATRESELEEPERNHVCNPNLVEHWKDIAKGKQTRFGVRPPAPSLRYLFVH